MKEDFFEWTVKIRISKTWVEDGFNLTDERLRDMVQSDLQYAYGNEIEVKVIKSPSAAKIAVAQGYKDSSEMEQSLCA